MHSTQSFTSFKSQEANHLTDKQLLSMRKAQSHGLDNSPASRTDSHTKLDPKLHIKLHIDCSLTPVL